MAEHRDWLQNRLGYDAAAQQLWLAEGESSAPVRQFLSLYFCHSPAFTIPCSHTPLPPVS